MTTMTMSKKDGGRDRNGAGAASAPMPPPPPLSLQDMSPGTAVVLLLLLTASAEGATTREIELESRYLNVVVDRAQLDRTVKRLLDDGALACVGFHRTGSRWIAQRYGLTPAGEDAARAIATVWRALLDLPRVFLGRLAEYDAMGEGGGPLTSNQLGALLAAGTFEPLPIGKKA